MSGQQPSGNQQKEEAIPIAKLPSQYADETRETEVTTFAALEPGIYTARFSDLKAKQSSNEHPMWAIEFDQVREVGTGKKATGKLFTNLVLIDSVKWKVAQFYAAFNADPSTDTDELLGRRIRLEVSQREITQGKRKGQIGNDVGSMLPLVEGDDGFVASAVASGGGGAKASTAVAPKAAEPEF